MNIFAVDDTGSPGNPSESTFLKSDRKTYVAVFISKQIKKELINEINAIKRKHESNTFQINEFHFSDLVNNRKEFKNLKLDLVKEIFSDFSKVLRKYSWSVFVQTMTPRTLKENGLIQNDKTIDDNAIDFLIQRLIPFVEEQKLNNQFKVVIDEGLMKSGQRRKQDSLKKVTNDNFLYFENSTENILIQVADYFAFGVNKHQMVSIKERITETDKFIITEINKVFAKSEISGLKASKINRNGGNKELYDKTQLEVRKEMGIYDYWLRSMK